MTRIFYVPACPSAGKTYQIEAYAADLIKKGQQVIVVQPTKELIDKTVTEMSDRFPDLRITKIYQKLLGGKVRPQIIEFFNKADGLGQAIFMTWSAFSSLDYIHHKENWHLVIDEIPNVAPFKELKVSKTHATLTDAVALNPVGPKYGHLEVIDKGVIRSLADNDAQDEGWEPFKEVAARLKSGHYENYVIQNSFNNLVRGRGQAEKRTLTVFSILQPSICEGFASVVIAGARAEETLLFKLWSQKGVRFKMLHPIVEKLRYQTHKNGHLVRFFYGSERKWSKRLSGSEENNLLQDLIQQASVRFPGKAFAYLSNKGCQATADLEDKENNVVALPAWSHGLNDYAKFNNILITGAYNATPSAIAFLTDMFGITEEEQRVALMCHTCYQALCRSSIRDSGNKDIKTFILPDRFTAAWCQGVFPGSSCSSLDIDSAPVKARGRKKTHSSRAEGKKASQHRIRQEQIEFSSLDKILKEIDLKEIYLDDEDIYTLYFKGNYVPLFRGTCLRQTDDRGQFVTGHFFMAQDRFARLLEARSKISINNKADNDQASPAFFEANRSVHTNIGKDNVVLANDLWLDFDHTHLTPKQLSELFPSLKIYTYETFSSTKDDMRYRAWIPMTGPVTNKEYRRLFQMVKTHIEDNGYTNGAWNSTKLNLKFHGLDHKPNASDKFYLPCRPKDGRKKTFRKFVGKGRKELDVDAWLQLPVYEDDYDTFGSEPMVTNLYGDLTPEQEASRNRALDKYLATDSHQYDALGRLHWTLVSRGIRGYHWETTMNIAVHRSNSPADRRRDMKRMKRFAY